MSNISFSLSLSLVRSFRTRPTNQTIYLLITTKPMIKIRQFRLKRRFKTLLRSILRKKTRSYHRVDQVKPKPGLICNLITRLKSKARALCNPGWIRDRAHEPLLENRHVAVPKGKTAVYVGSEDGVDFHRLLVPVIYFNHPLFGELLREAEEEFGFHHAGGITIPCRITEFEKVQTRIAAGR